jgi:hypothetical protein
VAIVQISRITQRSGLQQDLPQLAGAEFGWSVDQRRLFIGNGTLEEGAPVVGNTEILTEFSDLLAIAPGGYTYRGEAAGYEVQTGPTPSDPISMSIQSWMDQWATVLDFGAVGDGVMDCTDAINRALYEIYCRQTNPQIRRSLFFPGGVYRVTGTIVIPTWATLIGEGARNSVIQLLQVLRHPMCFEPAIVYNKPVHRLVPRALFLPGLSLLWIWDSAVLKNQPVSD